ncbi:unnamed protein product [Rhizophagus irregularis]|uniref:Tc1-like transposase DDE domain-containing protein n=2 Tax=Rhizophagus irregularis TaxID=588596 RepID=A0A915YYG4_9GLOM|nr:unnamed protein product [Rhizophagus irregularis]
MTVSKKERQRQTILQLWSEGMRKGTEIHKITRIPLSTIYDNIKKLKEDNIVNRKREVVAQGKLPANFPGPLDKVSEEIHQFQRGLWPKNWAKWALKATPMLTAAHKQKRIEWAQQHINDNWNTTLFSDETAFQLFRNTVKRWHKKIRPIRPMPKDRTKIFTWGGFCVTGKTSLFCFRRIMNAEFYVEILENHIPEIDAMLGDDWRLQQDNDPKHTSRLAKEFLQNNVPEVMDWPSNSPDLNLIENLWAIVKGNVERRMPKNLNELESFMAEEWSAIPDTVIKNLAGSMKRRCELIIENNGERISY